MVAGMQLFPKIPQGRDLWAWPPAVIFFALIAGFLSASAIRIVIRERALARERQALEERIAVLEAEKSRSAEAIRALGAPEAVERLAKERLNFKNPGEEVVVVRPGGSPAPLSPRTWRSFLPEWLASFFDFLRR